MRMILAALKSVFRPRKPDTQASKERLTSAADLFKAGNIAAASSLVDAILKEAPQNAAALRLKGAILDRQGLLPKALESYTSAIYFDYKNPRLRLEYASLLQKTGDQESAELEIRQAQTYSRGGALETSALGHFLVQLNRMNEATECLRSATKVNPKDDESLYSIGMLAFYLLEFSTAHTCFCQISPNSHFHTISRITFGQILLNMGRLDEAESILSAALQKDPDNPELIHYLANKEFLAGNWEEGFRLYENRFNFIGNNPKLEQNLTWHNRVFKAVADISAWKGESLAGKHILVWSEQGYGDAIMTLRLIPLLKARYGAKSITVLSVSAERSLFENAVGNMRFLELHDDWKALRSEFDFHCSLLSLPFLMGIRTDNIPDNVPYLHPSPTKIGHWQRQLKDINGLRVGLAWAGNPQLQQDALRSLALRDLAPLFELSGVHYFSLQKDRRLRDESDARNFPFTDWMDQCADFMDTAALIQNLDLVIAVDTAVAHLAGALGKPVWLLNRFESEWRWMRGREDSVWYPSMRIFNQTEARNWLPVLSEVAQALKHAEKYPNTLLKQFSHATDSVESEPY